MSLFYPLIQRRPLSAEAQSYRGLNKIEYFSKASQLQAGLLTLGSSYRPHLPDRIKRSVVFRERFEQQVFFETHSAAVVPDHSGGPVPVSKGFPFKLERVPECTGI